jgi:parallel beta-helix repeat protein
MSHVTNPIVRNNLVHHSFGEGVGIFFTSTGGLVEKNTIYDSRAAGIYLANRVTNTVIRNNLVYANADDTARYWRWQGGILMPGPGIGIDDEPYMWSANPGTSEDNSFYGNVVIGCSRGFFAWQGAALSYFKDSVVYGNTLIDNYRNFDIANRAENSFVRNNISLCQTADGTWPCSHSNVTGAITGLTYDYNNWSSAAPAALQGAHDVVGDPVLVKTSAWRSIPSGTATGREAALSVTSPSKIDAMVLPAPYDAGIDPRALYTDFSVTPPLVNQYARGDTPSFGAFPYFTDIPEPEPSPPGILTNPGFESGTAWTFYSDGSAAYEESAVSPIAGTKSGHVTVTTAGANVQLYQTAVPVTASTQYRLTFVARSNVAGREIKLRLHKHGTPYTNYGLNNYVVALTTSNATYTIDFTTNSSATNDARFVFWLADADVAADQFWLDTVTLEAIVVPAAKPITTQRLAVSVADSFVNNLSIDTDQAGTIALSGSCYTPTTAVTVGVNWLRLTDSAGMPLAPGTYSDCSCIVTSGGVASDPVGITAFTVPETMEFGLSVAQ